MKEKIFLTSCIAMGVIAPAMAEPSNTGTFPNDGYMQEDYTYTNAATSTNMDGVYEGTVNAVAEYDIIDYIVNAGQYLPADSETVITCPAGSFCPGISGNVQYNQTTPQGIQTCPTGYASSVAGASSDTQCYRACDINNMGANGSISSIAHATAISGNDYYGNGVDTCEPTGCDNGYHVQPGIPDLVTLIGTDTGIGFGYRGVNDLDRNSSSTNDALYAQTIPGNFVVDYGTRGIVKGRAKCSTRGVANIWYKNNNTFESDHFTSTLPNSSGMHCYCHLDSYTPYENQTSIALPDLWMYMSIHNSDEQCAGQCAYYCSTSLRGSASGELAFRAALLGSIESSPAMCEANTITINWTGTTPEAINANNAGTATYGSDVRTPVSATPVKGKTFRGWRFNAPEQTNLP